MPDECAHTSRMIVGVRCSVAAVLALGACADGSPAGTDAAAALGADREAFDLGPGFADAMSSFADATSGVPDSGAGSADAEPMMLADAGGSGLCPPGGPFGVRRGDVLPDPPLVDCDGNPFSLHSLCEKKAAWQFHFAGW